MKYMPIFILALLVLSACETAPTETPEVPEQPAEQQPETPEAPQQPEQPAPEQEAEEPEQPKVAPEEDASDDLAEFFSGMDSAKWKIEYDVVTTGNAESRMEMTQYMLNDNLRMDVTTQGVEMQSFVSPEELVVCYRQGGWSCTKMDLGEYEKSDFEKLEEEMKSGEAGYQVTRDGTKTVAGMSTQCFKIITDDGTARYCFAESGAPLYMHIEGGGQATEMTATSYSTSVSSGDFTPPATPSEGGFPMGGTQPSGSNSCEDTCAQMPAEYRDQCLASC